MSKILSCAIIRDSEGRLLLQLRDKDPERNKWVLFGGHVETEESERDAVLREIDEELHYKIKNLTFFKKYYDKDTESPIWIVGESISIDELNLSEGYDMKFFSRLELENIDIGFNQRSILMDYLNEVVDKKQPL